MHAGGQGFEPLILHAKLDDSGRTTENRGKLKRNKLKENSFTVLNHCKTTYYRRFIQKYKNIEKCNCKSYMNKLNIKKIFDILKERETK